MTAAGVKAATDITGFGLAGHALKMARASGVSIYLNMLSVPLLGDVLGYTDAGCIPGASFRNLAFAEPDTAFDEKLDYNHRMIAFDAQTSGGLLMGVKPGIAVEMIEELKAEGNTHSAVVGHVEKLAGRYLYLNNC
jgi:selenide,water dikinase